MAQLAHSTWAIDRIAGHSLRLFPYRALRGLGHRAWPTLPRRHRAGTRARRTASWTMPTPGRFTIAQWPDQPEHRICAMAKREVRGHEIRFAVMKEIPVSLCGNGRPGQRHGPGHSHLERGHLADNEAPQARHRSRPPRGRAGGPSGPCPYALTRQ